MQNSEAAEPQEVPKNRPTLWALRARAMGNEYPYLVYRCPTLGPRVPI